MDQAVADRENGQRQQDGEKPSGPEYLLEMGIDGFRRRVRNVIARRVTPLVAQAERNRRFPREAISELGRAGLLREAARTAARVLHRHVGGSAGVKVLYLRKDLRTAAARTTSGKPRRREVWRRYVSGELAAESLVELPADE